MRDDLKVLKRQGRVWSKGISSTALLLLGNVKCWSFFFYYFLLSEKIANKASSLPPHTAPLSPQDSKSQQNITPFDTISWGVFEFNLVPAPLKMTHYSAMIAKLSPIDSAVALKPCCGHGQRALPEREIERGRERESEWACLTAASIVFQVCLASRWQLVSHCEEAEPSYFLPWEEQQPVWRAQSPVLPKYLMHSGALGVLPLFLSSLLVPYDKDRIILLSRGLIARLLTLLSVGNNRK